MTNLFYTLSFESIPGKRLAYHCPITEEVMYYTVPASGKVVCYVGQSGTTHNGSARLSKHKTYVRSMWAIQSGESVKSFKNYPIYRFLAEHLWDSDELEINIISRGGAVKDYVSETNLIESYRATGVPLMNITCSKAQSQRYQYNKTKQLNPRK
jgi:hypothetical protein